ncbi:biosynthetic-type acetolactate synthase large subunit [Anaerofustis stercorihominis]|uniref:Acetolactate synthase n=1 Tax=Anaerofustis stercorihominis DSM 17244 TaxID=445971 RepID=B1CAQ6_9FIRM|nr:biosynthetic-type acetolactate synthase large subunit [Anaerofustis stercorihominis]EDS71353.1 acetolactate synthase, large subunit, biosynthetic type [Anaerofustis stercorihominis DSM 17244]MCQ4794750.1 biosynthetic-type acetolactate synthase large subunit [Anaerofustis stercorihominis]
MKLTGSEVLAEVLLEHGVDTVFGYPGGAALNIYDVLYKYSDKIKHVLTAHEQGAAHAADGYYRATGKTGVVIATSGPGATNLVTGIATAFMDSIPMIAITANVPDNLIGRDSFQEICITGVTLPITKHNFFVNKVEDLAPALRDAFRIANSGRKGPVLVDITKDVTAALTEYEKSEPLLLYKNPVAKEEDIEEVAKLINESEKPVIYFGGGVVAAEALDELNELLSKGDIPATNTLMATGVLGYNNKRRLGMIGMHGTVAANKAIHNADLVLALGTRFSDRVALNPNKFASHAKKIQVDLDMSEINKNVFVHKSVISDVKDFLVKLLPLIEKRSRKEWIDQTLLWRKTPVEDKYYKGDLHPGDIVTTACAMADKEPIIVTDVGQHQMWAAQYLKNVKPIKFLTSGGLGTMGYSYGAAIGAAVGSPDKRVIQFVGDGSFHMCLNEACTAVSQNLPIITIIMNNGVLGMVYQWQTVFYEKRYSQTVLNRKTDFVKLAEAFGLTGFRAETLEEFEDIYEKALKIDGPVWIDCRIEELERVLPMIPNGGTVDDMIIN